MNGKTALERAFELADQGLAVSEIRIAIHREGYEPGQLYGPTIASQLGKRVLAAKAQLSKRARQKRRS